MDDRDKDLTHLFVRDLDEIALPKRGAWRPQARKERVMSRTSRYLLNTAAVAAVLLLALVVGYQLQQRQEVAGPPASASPSASSSGLPTPSQNTSPATATPGASTAPSSVYSDDFGFVVFSQASQGAAIRTESGVAPPFGTLAAVPPGLAVSPDGTRAAYWTSSTTPSQLRMFTTLGNATEQILLTLPAGTRGGGVAWASDSAALLYSTETGSFGIGGGTNSATLDTFELAGPPLRHATLDTQTNTGFLYRPIAWDRSANLAAAGLTGEGGFMGFYATARTDQSSPIVQKVDASKAGIGMGSVHGSSDGKVVLGIAIAGTQVKYWPIADYAANKTASGNGMTGAQWQPGTHKIGVMVGDGFVLYNADDGTASSARTAKAGMAVRTFRADGTAVVLGLPKGSGSDVTEHILMRLGDGASVTFEVTGTLTASVRLR